MARNIIDEIIKGLAANRPIFHRTENTFLFIARFLFLPREGTNELN